MSNLLSLTANIVGDRSVFRVSLSSSPPLAPLILPVGPGQGVSVHLPLYSILLYKRLYTVHEQIPNVHELNRS